MSWVFTAGYIFLAMSDGITAESLLAVETLIWVDREPVARRVEIIDYNAEGELSGSRSYHHDGRSESWERLEGNDESVVRWAHREYEPEKPWSRELWRVATGPGGAHELPYPRASRTGGDERDGDACIVCEVGPHRRFERRLTRDERGHISVIDEGAVVHTLYYEGDEPVRIVSEDGLETHRWVLSYRDGRLHRADGLARRFELSYDQRGRLERVVERWFDDSGWRTEIRYIYGARGGGSAALYPKIDFGYLFNLRGEVVSLAKAAEQSVMETISEGYCSVSEAISR